MCVQSRKIFQVCVTASVLFAALALAGGHHNLNGTWMLEPAKSEFAGQPVIQSGTVTIYDRQHNIYISRNFTYDGENQSFEYSFSTDGRENSTIHQGKTLKNKAKWDGDVLQVKMTQNDATTVERYSLAPDGSLMLVVDRPGHRTLTLFFQRQ